MSSSSSRHTVTVALAGNPNSGKTTLFNALTGAHQHVGNYPGVTVEKKTGELKHKGVHLEIVDLPGTYSLTAYTTEELVARDYIFDEQPDVVVDVIDASNLERNLYLAVQFLEMGVPMVLALNMSDLAQRRGIRIDTEKLSQRLNVPVIPIVATRRQGIGTLLDCIVETAQRRAQVRPVSIPYSPELTPKVDALTAEFEQHRVLTDRYPARWLSVKCLESDAQVLEQLSRDGPAAEAIRDRSQTLVGDLRRQLADEPANLISDGRYEFILGVCDGAVQRDPTARETLSDRIDKVATHRLAGPAIMLGIVYVLYWCTFSLVEAPLLAWAGISGSLVSWTEAFFDWLGALATAHVPEGLMQSLLVDGVIAGAGGVFGFVPLIAMMFLGIAVLEDSGYMARIAFLLDRVLRVFGLHGSSVLALIVSGGIAGGCAVPGVMAARTLRDRRERFATILVCGLMNCGAKLPVYALLIAAFFAQYKPLLMFGMTVGSWGVAMLAALVLRRTVLRGPKAPFVMELPPYRLPTFQGLLRHMWDRTWTYIHKAGTVILAISILIWALMTFPRIPAEQIAGQSAEAQAAAALEFSLAGRAGRALDTIMAPIGSDWQTNIALVGGFAAKEVIISTLGTAYSLGNVDTEHTEGLAQTLAASAHWSPRKALALMVFIMFYAPCMSTIAVIIRETQSWRWGLFGLAYPTGLAWVLACLVFQGGRWLGLP